jgi:hypothetical protein
MPPALRVRWFARRLVSILLASWGVVGCYKLDDNDCELSKTCSSERLFTLHREQVSEDCQKCLRDSCEPQARACSTDFRCSRSVECLLKVGPRAYQECLSGLLQDGIATADDSKGAWEGNTRLFDKCLNECNRRCGRDESNWECVSNWDDGKPDGDLTARIAVRLYYYRSVGDTGSEITHVPAQGVWVKPCPPVLECDASGGRPTNAEGVVDVPVRKIDVENVYFAITSGDSGLRFPPTYYYPGRLSTDPLQPIAIYLVSTEAVRTANRLLLAEGDAGVGVDWDSGLLEGAGQSVILPDACREQATRTAVDVTLHARLKGTRLPQCVNPITRASEVAVPCVWYGFGSNGFPDTEATTVDGWGGGIVGLPGGDHEVHVCDRDNYLVASRSLRMKPGWLTIARTWPFSSASKTKLPCEEPAVYSSGRSGPAN